jgi:hypothetical protein
MAVHHPALGLEPFGGHPCAESLDHPRGPVGGQHLRAEPRGRQAQAAGSRGDIEERVARPQARQPKPVGGHLGFARRDVFVVQRRDRIPRLDGRGVLNLLPFFHVDLPSAEYQRRRR